MKSIASGYLAFIFCLTIIPFSSLFGSTISCSHAELCKLVQLIAIENSIKDLKTESLINISGDPHEYEPSTAEIKSLLGTPFLLTGPNELNPWIKKINFQRSKNSSLKTISLLFEKKHFDFYPKASAEALSHFWLYPKIYCSFKTQLEKELKQSGLAVAEKKCDAAPVEASLSLALSKIKMPVILTHDALLPLLTSLSPLQTIVAIKGSGHHEETGTDAIKKMYKALENTKVIWIVEQGINVPQNILNKIRPVDIVIKIDTAKSKSLTAFSVLEELAQKLNNSGEKK
jgi:hypothetical protein